MLNKRVKLKHSYNTITMRIERISLGYIDKRLQKIFNYYIELFRINISPKNKIESFDDDYDDDEPILFI